ncbi:MAG: hypothetical protein IJT40_03150 [Firmicutes bacterium]|nr:hypothetical protein [Bacillota bacterium]
MKKGLRVFASIMIIICSMLLMISCGIAATSVSNTSASNYESENTDTVKTIYWSAAKNYVGEYVHVVGTVVSSKYAEETDSKPTFLNIGLEYPNPDRFTVVIWNSDRNNFTQAPESYYLGKKVVVTGFVQMYEGSPEIVISSEDEIEIAD